MSTFEVLALGVGDSFSERHHSTALLLSCDGFHLGIDCPDSYRGVLRAAALKAGRALTLPDIDHLLVTHVHGDHMNGVEGVAFFKHFAEGKRLNLITSAEVRTVIWDERLRASMGTLWDGSAFQKLGFDDYFVHQRLAWEGPTEVGPFTLHARRTVHHVPTSALRIEAGGHSLGFSSDTAFDPSLIEFLAPADLIIHETNFGPAHTPYASLAALPEALRRKMRLVHYPDSFDCESSVIRVLREGEVLRVGEG